MRFYQVTDRLPSRGPAALASKPFRTPKQSALISLRKTIDLHWVPPWREVRLATSVSAAIPFLYAAPNIVAGAVIPGRHRRNADSYNSFSAKRAWMAD